MQSPATTHMGTQPKAGRTAPRASLHAQQQRVAWPKLPFSARAGRQTRGEDFFVAAFLAEPTALVDTVKLGVPSGLVSQLAESMRVPKERLMITLGLPRATMQRKAASDSRLAPNESSRVLGMTRLIGQVQAMVNESGEPKDFDAAAWLASWLEQAIPALGGRRPAEFMDTAEGQTLVSRLLAQAQSGAYA